MERRSGGLFAILAHQGELGTEAQASSDGGAEDFRVRSLEQLGNPRRRITLDIHQQKYQALESGKAAQGFFQVGAKDIAAAGQIAGGGNGQPFIGEGYAFSELLDQGAIDDGLVRLFGGLKGANEGVLEDILGLDLTAGHVERYGKDAVAVAVVDIALAVFQPARSLLTR